MYIKRLTLVWSALSRLGTTQQSAEGLTERGWGVAGRYRVRRGGAERSERLNATPRAKGTEGLC